MYSCYLVYFTPRNELSRYFCNLQAVKQKIKHDWYQTEAQVVVTILLKNATKDQVKVQYGPRSVSILTFVTMKKPVDFLDVSITNVAKVR